MQPQQDSSKPLPSVELSLKFMSWSVKELAASTEKMQRMLDQKLSEISMQLREVKNAISGSKEAPF